MTETKSKKPLKARGGKTNKKKGSLVKTIVLEDRGKWVQPKSGDKFFIDENPAFPSITFEIETAEQAPYEWSWTLSWPAAVSGLRESANRGIVKSNFVEKKEFKQDEKKWAVNFGGPILGGTLTVQVKAGNELFKRSIYICGKNPGEQRVKDYLESFNDIDGFDEIVAQESKYKHFINADGQPVVSFDGGYGLVQMTNPPPTFEQCWNWKENIKRGIALYREKRVEAKDYLSNKGKGKTRTYAAEQLKLETLTRWNGGYYHVWDQKNSAWARKPNILCDTETSNIGWNINKKDNKGKTEDELHDRDKDEYKKPPKKEKRKWHYSGICYADHVSE